MMVAQDLVCEMRREPGYLDSLGALGYVIPGYWAYHYLGCADLT